MNAKCVKEVITLIRSMKEKRPMDDEDYGYNHFADDLVRALKEELKKEMEKAK